MKITCHNAQHIGTRQRQEDSFGFSNQNDPASVRTGGVLAVLADGMGGHSRGDEASTTAVSVFMERYTLQVTPRTVRESLQDALFAANAAVVRISGPASGEAFVGTTLTAAVILDTRLHWISVGDSRVYLLHDGKLEQLSHDHVYAEDLDQSVETGTITDAEAKAHPSREALTSCLGMTEIERYDQGSREIFNGDIVLVSSDGLHKFIDDKEIESTLLTEHPNPAEALLTRVMQQRHPKHDNTTILTMQCGRRKRLPRVLASRSSVALLVLAAFVALLVLSQVLKYLHEDTLPATESGTADTTETKQEQLLPAHRLERMQNTRTLHILQPHITIP
jgi:PPM family protein phosphatase